MFREPTKTVTKRKAPHMKYRNSLLITCILAIAAATVTPPAVAAGIFDKLNDATKGLNNLNIPLPSIKSTCTLQTSSGDFTGSPADDENVARDSAFRVCRKNSKNVLACSHGSYNCPKGNLKFGSVEEYRAFLEGIDRIVVFADDERSTATN